MKQPGDGPAISVITPYNGSQTVRALVHSLTRQSLAAEEYELLVGCEAGAEPDLGNLGELPFAARIVPAPKPVAREFHTAPRLRNSAIRQARGARLVFIDSDCIASPKCLERHAAADAGTAICGTKLEVVPNGLPDDGDHLFERLSAGAHPDERLTHQPQPGRCGCWGFWTCNASAPADLVIAAGLFDEHGFRCHDLDLAYRLQLGGARFRLDPECQVVHVEHGRSIWLTRARIAGLSWLAQKHPDAAAGAENLLAIFRNLFHNNLLEAEEKFTRVTASLPGVRTGLGWVTPCGHPLPRVLATTRGLQTIVRRHEHGVQVFLRLAEQCWDYSIIVPDAKVVKQPLFSVVVLPSDAEDGITRTVESLLSQTCQSFELVLTATAETAGRLRSALKFSACGRLRTLLVPLGTTPAGVVEHVRRSCKGDYLVRVEAGSWLREDLLAEVTTNIAKAPCGSAAEIRRRVDDWRLLALDPDEPTADDGVNVADGVCVHSLASLHTEFGPQRGLRTPVQNAKNYTDAFSTGGLRSFAPDESLRPALTELDSPAEPPSGPACEPKFCAFTFDSGPHPILTHRVLDALDETGIKASFFFVGTQLRRCPDVVRRIVASGHEVAVQGYDYEDLSRCVFSAVDASIKKTLGLISDLTGLAPRWFRPPFGRCSALVREVCRLQALTPVGWHVSSEDWTGQHHQRTVSTVLAHGLEGAVVLFHDGCGDPWETAQAVSSLGRVARAAGTRGTTLSDLESLVSLPAL